ncbi:tyrosine-protein phosphatase non-receptor type 61F isoform X1 [Drosophila serrata]|uniref:tyrosine-protein phosphatase non-receptor type 61F isoform X1 n=1 Tax=Drosophila serrata TaxID=7274 RepID=UPI000A1CFD26|nr:tyrosine-protein phosphatase non-receptor type 61F isoform X1 [Drosophila serrata]
MSDQKTSGSSPTAISMDNAAARQKIEAEYHSKKPVWPRYYKEICEKCDREAKEQQFSTSESERHQNRGLNRYRDVNPYDHSRIVLKRGSVDYINANLVKMERAARKYILTQGPLEDTVGHFWLMVWEQASTAILMLNKLMEKKQIKCHLYWPNEMGADKALKLPHVKLTVELVRCETYQNFVRRWFKLTDLETQQSREVLQFHYTTWPDFGIPGSPDAFLKFLQQVRDSGCLSRDVGPAVVHCSAGIGRSGTFCLVDCCLVLIDQYGECNVSKVLCELRSYRMGLIQTADQLDFSYQAIIEGIQKLQDPTFLNAEEPTISNDTDTNHTLDELPPPLPPRVQSLILPLAPNSGGVLSLDMRAAQANGAAMAGDFIGELSSKDALNNIINHPHDIIRDAEVADRLRPLPPLPLVRDGNDSDSDEDDDDDDYSLEDIEDDDEDEEEEEYETINNDDHDTEPVNGHVPIPTTTTQADDVNANNEKPAPAAGEQISKANGIDTIPGQQLSASPENELKRRKRNEYQASLEQKVNDIKRKQRENEDSQVAAKKRRSLLTYIAAGVVVGVICAYAYTKLG